MTYELVMGLEIHAEMNTRTKMFCNSLNDPDEHQPNTNICPVCMGHPGTLPVINGDAVKKVQMVGLALGGVLSEYSQFDRKNYFYPDLPKGYQISQYEHPLVVGGALKLSNGRTIRITRIHLEEDTGRLVHDTNGKSSLIDFNRAGVPLMELVTEPDFRTGEEVREFGEELQKIVRYVGASDADMEKGQMRVEVNISLRPEGAREMGVKVEVKNINSFKFAADAAAYEEERQSSLLERGDAVIQETRGWNETKQETFSQRAKESAHDYRYFPEPDLPPLRFNNEYVETMLAHVPELPREKSLRFKNEYKISEDAASIITREKSFADYFEQVVSELRQHDKEALEKSEKNLEQVAASYFVGEFTRILNQSSFRVAEIKITPENFGELLAYVAEDKISHVTAKKVLEEMAQNGEDPSDIIDRLGLWQMTDEADMESIASHVIASNQKPVDDFRAGKAASLQFLVGQVMKETRGKANPKVVQDVIKKLLAK